MNPQKSQKLREKFRTIHYIFYIEYERLEFLFNFPINLLNMNFVNREESKKKQSIVVMDLDELEKRLSKGYRVYKKIRTTLNLKDEWDFIKLKILFMRQYSQLFMDDFKPDLSYFYLQKADEYVEKRKKINRSNYEDDVNFYKYLVEIEKSNYYILTDQYSLLLRQCETYIECASKLEEYKKKPINILVPFRIYIGCGMIYEFFNQDYDIVVNSFLRGVQIMEKNINDLGRYFLQNDLLIYVQAYVKIVKCKLRLRDYENAELWARSTLTFIEQNQYLLRLESNSKVVKKIKNLHNQAFTELITKMVFQSDKKQNDPQAKKSENSDITEQHSQIAQNIVNTPSLPSQIPANVVEQIRLIKMQSGANTNRNYNTPVNMYKGADTNAKKNQEKFNKSKFEIMVKDEEGTVVSQQTQKDNTQKVETPSINFEGFGKAVEQIQQNVEAKSNFEKTEETLQNGDNTVKESANSQIDGQQQQITSKEDEIGKKELETHKNADNNTQKEENNNNQNEDMLSEMKMREKQHKQMLKNLANTLVDQARPRNSTNLKPISQIRQEIEENNDGVDFIKINGQLFSQEKNFFNLPRQFPGTLNSFNNGYNFEENEEQKQEQEQVGEDKDDKMYSIKKISSQITNSQEESDSSSDPESPRSRSNSIQSNNESYTSIRRYSRLSIQSLKNIEESNSERKIPSYTKISGQKKRSSLLEIPNINFFENQDKSQSSHTKNFMFTPQEHSLTKINSNRVIHLIPENQSEDDSPIKNQDKQKLGSLNHIKFEIPADKKQETKSNQYKGNSIKNIPITPTSMLDCYESPKSNLNLFSSKNIEQNHFALDLEKNGAIKSEASPQKQNLQDFDDMNNDNLSRITKINRSEMNDLTLNSEKKQSKRMSSFTDLNESQNKSATPNINFQVQKIQSFNHIEQIPEAFEDDSPHKFNKSRDPTPQYFNQIRQSTQQSVLNENIKTESNKVTPLDKGGDQIQQVGQFQQTISLSKEKKISNQDYQNLISQQGSQKSQASQNQEKPELYSSSNSKESGSIQNQQQMKMFKDNKRPSILQIPGSAYQSPFSTPNTINQSTYQNLLKNSVSSTVSPSPEIHSPNSLVDIKIDFTKVQSINQIERQTSNKLSDSKNYTDSFKDGSQPINNRVKQLTQEYNKQQLSFESNDYFPRHRNSFSIQLSENNFTQGSLTKFPYSSENQTPANHFLGSSTNQFLLININNQQNPVQGGLQIPQSNNQPRKKSIFSDLKEQQDLQSKLEKIKIDVERIDSDRSSYNKTQPSPKKSMYGVFQEKDQKQTDQSNKFQEYLAKTEIKSKKTRVWNQGNLNIFFQTNTKQTNSNQQTPQKKIEYSSMKTKSTSKNITKLDESEQSLFQFKQKKQNNIDFSEQSFKINLDCRPSIITPSSNTLTPFLGKKENFQSDAFSQGINSSSVYQLTPDQKKYDGNQNFNEIIPNERVNQIQIQTQINQSDTPQIFLQVPQQQLEQDDNIQTNQKNNLVDQLKAEPPMIIFQNKINEQSQNPNLNHRRFSNKDSAFKQIIQAKARKSMVNLDDLQKEIIIQSDHNQLSINTQQNQPSQNFFSQQISPISLRQSSPRIQYFPPQNSSETINNITNNNDNIQRKIPSLHNLKQNFTPRTQASSISHQVSPKTDRNVGSPTFTRFFPISKSQQSSKLNSPNQRQYKQKLINEDNSKSQFQQKQDPNMNLHEQAHFLEPIPYQKSSNGNYGNPQINTQNGQSNKKIIRIMSKLSSRDFSTISPQDMYLFQYNNPKQISQNSRNGISEYQNLSSSTKSSYPIAFDSRQSQQQKQLQHSDSLRRYNIQNVNNTTQQKFIGTQAPQQLQQFHKINQMQSSNLLNHQIYFNKQLTNTNYQSGATNNSDQNQIQHYQKPLNYSSHHNRANSQQNFQVYSFQTEGNYEESWKAIQKFNLDLIPRPSNKCSHRRVKTQTSSSKTQISNRQSTEEVSHEYLQNYGKFYEFQQGKAYIDDEEQMQDDTTLDEENFFTNRSHKTSNKKSTSQNNFGILSDYKLDSSNSQVYKRVQMNQPFLFNEADIDRYIIKKDIQEVVNLQEYFQNQYPKDVMNNRESRQNIFKKIQFKKQLNEDDKNVKKDENQLKPIQIYQLNDNSPISGEESQKDSKRIKLKHINSILLDHSNSSFQQGETEDAQVVFSSKDTNQEIIKPNIQKSNFQKRNSFDLQSKGKVKNSLQQVKPYTPKVRQKKILKYKYEGFSQAFQENQKNDIFYEISHKNQEEDNQKENIVYDDTSSNSPSSDSSESESHSLSQNQTIEEKSNIIIQKQFIQFFEEKWKEEQDILCSIDYLKYPQWVVSTQRSSKATANIIFRTIKNQLSFCFEDLFLFPDNLLNSSQQGQNKDDSSFENKVKAIREKLIIQVCDSSTPHVQKESINQFQFLTYRNSILQSLQIQTNTKKTPVQDKITTIWPIVLCALFDYLKKNYKMQFIIPRIKNITFQGSKCVDKSVKLQGTCNVQQFIESNHLIPFGIDAKSASLIQIMLDQLVRFYMKKGTKVNGNVLFLNQSSSQNVNNIKQALTKLQFFQIFDPPIITKPKKKSNLKLRQKIKQAIYDLSHPSQQEKVNCTYWWENTLGRIKNIENSEILISRFKERFIKNRWSFLKFLSRQYENQFYFGWIKMFYQPENSEFEKINIFQQQSIKKKFFFQLFLQNYSDKKRKMSKIFSFSDFVQLFEESSQPIMSLEEYIMEIVQDKQSKKQNIFLIQCMQQVLLRLKIKENSFFLVLNNPTFGFSNIPTLVSHSLKGKSSYRCSQIIEEPKDDKEQEDDNANKLEKSLVGIQISDEIFSNQIEDQMLTKNSFNELPKQNYSPSFASYVYSLINYFPLYQVKNRYNFYLPSNNGYFNVFIRKVKSENVQIQNAQSQYLGVYDRSKSIYLIDYNFQRKHIDDIPIELSQEISFKNSSNSIMINKSSLVNQAKVGLQSLEYLDKDCYQTQYFLQNSSMQSEQNIFSPKSSRKETMIFQYQKNLQKFNSLLEQDDIQIFIYSNAYGVEKCGKTIDNNIFGRFISRYFQIKQIKLKFLRAEYLKQLNMQFTTIVSNKVGGKQEQWKRQIGINNLTLKAPPFELFKYSLILNNKDGIKQTKSFQEYTFLHRNPQLGKIIVKATIYNNPHQQNSLSYVLSIQQYKYKNKLWKVIFNSEDLRKYFGLSEDLTTHKVNYKNFDSQFVVRAEKICRCVLDQIILQKQNIYTQPIFRFQIQAKGQPSHINSYLSHKNLFIEPSFKDPESQCTFYLEQSVKSTRVVAHFTIKRFNQYIIITILKHIIEDIWILKLYLPHSQRRSISYFSTSDLSNLQQSDFRIDWFKVKNNTRVSQYYDFINSQLQKLTMNPKSGVQDFNYYPSDKIIKKSALKEALLFQKYGQLDEVTEQNQTGEETPKRQLQGEQIKQIKEGFTKEKQQSFLRRLQTNNFEQVGRFLQKNQPFISNLKKVSQEINEQFIQEVNKNQQNVQHNRFIELSAWEDIIQHLSIVQQNSSIFIQFKQSEKISINEFLDMKLTVNEKGSFVFIEYHLIPLNDKPLNFMQSFTEINYSTSQNYDILMRYSFYDKLNFFSKRVNLKEALNLYIADGFYQYQMSYMHSTLHYSDLLNICKYITYRIQSQSIGSIVSIDQEFKYLNESIFSK